MNKTNGRNRIILELSFCVMLILLGIIFNIYENIKNLNNIEINMVDISQGDASYIRAYSKNILIDTAEGRSRNYPQGEKVLYPYLLKKHVKCIDYLILSHFDSDHSGRSI